MTTEITGVEVRAAFFTSNAGRTDNQDAVLCGTVHAGISMDAPREVMLPAEEPWTIAIADGMGGYCGGAFAARFILEKIALRRPAEVEGWRERLLEIHKRLRETTKGNPEVAGCGATIAGIASHSASVALFHVGDARIYRRAGDRLLQLTEDDRFHEPGASHYGALLQALGGPAYLTDIEPHTHTLPFMETRLLLCTDGLTDTLPRSEIERVMCEQSSRGETVSALTQAAMRVHCADNLTVIVADLAPRAR